jgi:hypothetical protein
MDPNDPMRIIAKSKDRLRHVRDTCAVAPVLRHIRRALQSLELAQAELARYRGWSSPSDRTPAPLTPCNYAGQPKHERTHPTMTDDEFDPRQSVADAAPLHPANPAQPPQRVETNPHLNVPMPLAHRPPGVSEYKPSYEEHTFAHADVAVYNPEGEKR